MVEIEFRDGLVDSGDGGLLESAMRAEMAEVYDGLELTAPDMPAAGPDELNPPRGAFVVGYVDGRAICCGGIKKLERRVCEFKRMYVVPDMRGQGVARDLLWHLENRARRMGFEIARLDTGERQPAARHLYETSGYAPIGNFNDNPVASFFGEKRLI